MSSYVLIIDDERRHRELYSDTLRRSGFETATAGSAEEAEKVIAGGAPSMIVSDVRMPGADGLSFLRSIKERMPSMPFLLVTAYADVKDAVKALKMGAVDYLEKPIDLEELVAAVSDALGVQSASASIDGPPPELTAGIVAESPSMRSILRDAHRVAASDATILITGESGTGKEVLAAFVHRCSTRAQGPMVALNCASIPSNLLAGELFGHRKGAFTGAIESRKGFFKEADGGTFFLDEIGDMPLELQPALLRALETGRFMPLGEGREATSNFRLIAATHRDLKTLSGEGKFREDLYYRINVVAFELPPLRRRPEDILPLARHFLSARKGAAKRLSPSVSEALMRHDWPGNVRELANAMERACLLSNTEIILPEHLPPSLVKSQGGAIPWNSTDITQVATIDEMETKAIEAALRQTEGNRTKAAALLGISRRTLIYKLKRARESAQ